MARKWPLVFFLVFNYAPRKRWYLVCIGCPTRYRTRHFFNNFTTNEDIATKFEEDYRHTLQTHSVSFLTQRTYSCSIFIGVRIIKEMPGSVASGTHCIRSNKCPLKVCKRVVGRERTDDGLYQAETSRLKNLCTVSDCTLNNT